jgi:hypothetical protein
MPCLAYASSVGSPKPTNAHQHRPAACICRRGIPKTAERAKAHAEQTIGKLKTWICRKSLHLSGSASRSLSILKSVHNQLAFYDNSDWPWQISRSTNRRRDSAPKSPCMHPNCVIVHII